MTIDDISTFAELFGFGMIAGGLLSGIVFIISALISGFIGWIDRA